MNLKLGTPFKKSSRRSGSVVAIDTVGDLIHFAAAEFKGNKLYFGHGTDNSWDEAVYLVMSLLHLPAIVSELVLQRKLAPDEKKAALKLIDERKKRVPTAYLTHEAWFAGLPFYVDERVLIPRSPLAESIIQRFTPWVDPKKVLRILDIGTGSGCIAIACAKAFPRAKIDAVDVSLAALEVAQINCVRHRVTKRVRLLASDLFSGVSGETYDIIISNPPYVGRMEMQSLPQEYYYEPKTALFAGKNGDEIIARILQDAANYLSPTGILVVEVGNSASLVMQKYQHLPLVWLEFEYGEGEVFLLDKRGFSY